MTQKQFYESPSAELLVVRFEENIMSITGGANYASTPGGAGGDDIYDDGESFYDLLGEI